MDAFHVGCLLVLTLQKYAASCSDTLLRHAGLHQVRPNIHSISPDPPCTASSLAVPAACLQDARHLCIAVWGLTYVGSRRLDPITYLGSGSRTWSECTEIAQDCADIALYSVPVLIQLELGTLPSALDKYSQGRFYRMPLGLLLGSR